MASLAQRSNRGACRERRRSGLRYPIWGEVSTVQRHSGAVTGPGLVREMPRRLPIRRGSFSARRPIDLGLSRLDQGRDSRSPLVDCLPSPYQRGNMVMKVTINVDCSPEEARRFLGLPDVAPMQEALLQELHQRMSAGVAAMNPAELMKLWMPLGLEGWQELQKSFWGAMGGRGSDSTPSS